MLNTNGIRIAEDPAFVDALAELRPGFEVYLQFDSLNDDALKNLRGAALSRIRRQALANLEARNISTTLVCTVKRGVNDDEIGDIVRHALKYNCVRGVTFQPVQDAGRNEGFDPKTQPHRAVRDPPPHRRGLGRVRRRRHDPAALQSGVDLDRLRRAQRREGDPAHLAGAARGAAARDARTPSPSRSIPSCASASSTCCRCRPPTPTRPSGWARCSAACPTCRCPRARATRTSSASRSWSSSTASISASATSSAPASIS